MILNQAKAMEYAPKFFGVDGMDGILTWRALTPPGRGRHAAPLRHRCRTSAPQTASWQTHLEQFGDVPAVLRRRL